ncbi:MAG: gamma-glutamyl ligase [Burkholderiales bacterium]|jgi:carboxylate-amine ligase|nr:gamma-glutamyl ligase [Burkholderiales bacterium]MCE3267906.1 gamma-glutamyl ligase [Burkholderiales bacterium]
MKLGPFKDSKPYTIGVELELQLINLSNFDLTAASPDLIYLLNKCEFPGNVTPEITESMIEVCTDVMHNYNELNAQLEQIREYLVTACDKLNIGICGGGTHPFQKWSEQKIYNKQRFNESSVRYGYLAKQFTVFGQHVHIGCASGDKALYLLHALSRYVPHFIALSASSPFVQGTDTLFNSARLNSVFAFPLSGHAPFILNWEQFDNEYFAKMCKTGTIKTMKDFYWDIRPKPEYGTIELRVCDTPLTVKKAGMLAAYLQALCHYILEAEPVELSEDIYLVYNHNRFQACRFGMNGKIIDPQSYGQTTIREEILGMIHKIEPHAVELGSGEAFKLLRKYVVKGNDADYLREQFISSDSLEYIIDKSLIKFRQ